MTHLQLSMIEQGSPLSELGRVALHNVYVFLEICSELLKADLPMCANRIFTVVGSDALPVCIKHHYENQLCHLHKLEPHY